MQNIVKNKTNSIIQNRKQKQIHWCNSNLKAVTQANTAKNTRQKEPSHILLSYKIEYKKLKSYDTYYDIMSPKFVYKNKYKLALEAFEYVINEIHNCCLGFLANISYLVFYLMAECRIKITDRERYALIEGLRQYIPSKTQHEIFISVPQLPIYEKIAKAFPEVFRKQFLSYGVILYLKVLLNKPAKVLAKDFKILQGNPNVIWEPSNAAIINKKLQKEIGIYDKNMKNIFDESTFFLRMDLEFIANVLLYKELCGIKHKVLFELAKEISSKAHPSINYKRLKPNLIIDTKGALQLTLT